MRWTRGPKRRQQGQKGARNPTRDRDRGLGRRDQAKTSGRAGQRLRNRHKKGLRGGQTPRKTRPELHKSGSEGHGRTRHRRRPIGCQTPKETRPRLDESRSEGYRTRRPRNRETGRPRPEKGKGAVGTTTGTSAEPEIGALKGTRKATMAG